jgi:hypothetical protein
MKLSRYAPALGIGALLLSMRPAVSLAQPAQPPSPDDIQAWIQAVISTPAQPASEAPQYPNYGTFYSAQLGANWPPLPGDTLSVPFWDIGGGFYILADTDVDYGALQQEAESQLSPNMRLSMMAGSLLNSSYAYANPVYLTNMVAVAGASATVASFSIAGGTNFVPYDILMSTNMAESRSNWTWLGIGYTSNRLTFSNQPLAQAFYTLARPSRTMVVGWGGDAVGQCDVPDGLTNALMVAGGGGQSLALLTNGTVVAWGQNADGQGSVPTNLAGVTMISCGWYHDLALLTNGTVIGWGMHTPFDVADVPTNLTNVTVISAQAYHSLALMTNGTVAAWGYSQGYGETSVPSGLSNVVAISAGFQHNLAALSNGTVTAWGDNTYGQCTVPAGLSSVVDVEAGPYHSLALLNNGTVIAWGDGSDGETNVPAGLSNVVAIAAGGDPDDDTAYSLALKGNGTVVSWGEGSPVGAVQGMSNVFAIAAGADHALAIRTGPRTALITLEPADQYQLPGGNVTFASRGSGLYGVTYQWQTNGVNLTAATNATLTLTNLQSGQFTAYDVVVTDDGGMGSIVSSNANLILVTIPAVTSATLPTNQSVYYQGNLTLSVSASAPGQSNGFPIRYQWQFDGTNIAGATASSFDLSGDNDSAGSYSLILTNAAGTTNVGWLVTINYGTLAYYLATNLVSYTNGYTGSYGDMLVLSNWSNATYSGTNFGLLTNVAWSTNFWLHGVQGLPATPIGYSNGIAGQTLFTMVSPRHYLFATHVHPEGQFVAFLDTNNVIYWRTTLERADVTNTAAADTSVGILNADLPPSVGYLPVLPANLLSYLPTNSTNYVQGIGMNQDMRLFSQPMTFWFPAVVQWNGVNAAPFGLGTNWDVQIRGGDSSDPEMFLIGNQLALVTHNFTGGFAGSGPDYVLQINAINQAMRYLSTNNSVGTDYQLTPFLLTNWPTIH